MTATTVPTAMRSMPAQIRQVEDTARGMSFTAIGVPYGETIEIWGIRERFEPGSVVLDEDVPSVLRWEHAETIGRIPDSRDTEAGFELDGLLSATPRGTEAATLLADGVITRMSIGFIPDEYRVETDDDGIETIIHTRVKAREFSLVTFPAYSSATVTDVRHQQKEDTSMPPETLTRADLTAELTPLSQDLEDLQRTVDGFGDLARAAHTPAPMFRSMGHYVKRVAAGDPAALEFHKRTTTLPEDEPADDDANAATEGTTGATGLNNETALGAFIKFVQDRRDLIKEFDTGALPSKGMTVTYPQLVEDLTKVEEQLNELDPLVESGQVRFGDEAAKVRTFGGWVELSRQVIDRSDPVYLTTLMTALGIRYAKATNAALRAEIAALIRTRAADPDALELPASATVFDYRDAIIDAAEVYSDRGFNIDGLLVSKADYKGLQRLTYDNVPALKVNPADEFSGTLSLPQADGNLANVRVRTVFGGYSGPMSFYDRSAVKTLEQPNAPLRLQDDNVINLSRAFSLYGYAAIIKPFPSAILPLKKA